MYNTFLFFKPVSFVNLRHYSSMYYCISDTVVSIVILSPATLSTYFIERTSCCQILASAGMGIIVIPLTAISFVVAMKVEIAVVVASSRVELSLLGLTVGVC